MCILRPGYSVRKVGVVHTIKEGLVMKRTLRSKGAKWFTVVGLLALLALGSVGYGHAAVFDGCGEGLADLYARGRKTGKGYVRPFVRLMGFNDFR